MAVIILLQKHSLFEALSGTVVFLDIKPFKERQQLVIVWRNALSKNINWWVSPGVKQINNQMLLWVQLKGALSQFGAAYIGETDEFPLKLNCFVNNAVASGDTFSSIYYCCWDIWNCALFLSTFSGYNKNTKGLWTYGLMFL